MQAQYTPTCDACGTSRHVAPGQTLCDACRPGPLHERIARALGWAPEQAQSFSLPALRDLVRPVSPKLAWEITCAIADMTPRPIHPVSRAAKERHCDLMKQGFMKPAKRRR